LVVEIGSGFLKSVPEAFSCNLATQTAQALKTTIGLYLTEKNLFSKSFLKKNPKEENTYDF